MQINIPAPREYCNLCSPHRSKRYPGRWYVVKADRPANVALHKVIGDEPVNLQRPVHAWRRSATDWLSPVHLHVFGSHISVTSYMASCRAARLTKHSAAIGNEAWFAALRSSTWSTPVSACVVWPSGGRSQGIGSDQANRSGARASTRTSSRLPKPGPRHDPCSITLRTLTILDGQGIAVLRGASDAGGRNQTVRLARVRSLDEAGTAPSLSPRGQPVHDLPHPQPRSPGSPPAHRQCSSPLSPRWLASVSSSHHFPAGSQ